jgi:hypothetical protein
LPSKISISAKAKLRESLQFFLLPVLVFGAVLFGLYRLLSTDTWQAFFANFLATMLGAIIGIPIAFWINRQVQEREERIQRDRIIPALREELFVNLGHLSSWQKSGMQKLETVYLGIFLEDSSWKAFSDSGQLSFIQDAEMLRKISHAYSGICILRELSERYIDLIHLPDKKERVILQAPVAILISRGIDDALDYLETAIMAIK